MTPYFGPLQEGSTLGFSVAKNSHAVDNRVAIFSDSRDGIGWRERGEIVRIEKRSRFGWTLAVDEAWQTIAIGAPGHAGDVGGATIYKCSGIGCNDCKEHVWLHYPFPDESLNFGHSVAISDDVITLGVAAVGENSESGAVYL